MNHNKRHLFLFFFLYLLVSQKNVDQEIGFQGFPTSHCT
uniref:Uncharacterized protein n=1 Tax=Utricularia reniformis TaxID=192314 RepID=A0A1Y0B239_9LAMI|nr:hypothetical protein AEK19_MT1248 [Utricularia reniformis]ART31458.1 hypothetical protein AEK19_MT1248 [Utricularia reniformis]